MQSLVAKQLATFSCSSRCYPSGNTTCYEHATCLADAPITSSPTAPSFLLLPSPGGKVRPPNARVKELQSQVEALQAALQQRNPNSVAALLAASRPAADESTLVEELRGDVEALQVCCLFGSCSLFVALSLGLDITGGSVEYRAVVEELQGAWRRCRMVSFYKSTIFLCYAV